jgi:anti-sigma factor RsiW
MMTYDIDDTTLTAYVNGELDLLRHFEVEITLERNAEAREKVRQMRQVTELLRATFEQIPNPFPDLYQAKSRRHG